MIRDPFRRWMERRELQQRRARLRSRARTGDHDAGYALYRLDVAEQVAGAERQIYLGYEIIVGRPQKLSKNPIKRWLGNGR